MTLTAGAPFFKRDIPSRQNHRFLLLRRVREQKDGGLLAILNAFMPSSVRENPSVPQRMVSIRKAFAWTGNTEQLPVGGL